MGADDNILSNKFLPFGKARMGYPSGEARWGLMTIGRVTCSFPLGRSGWVILRGRLSGGVIRGTHYISIPNCRLHTEVCSPSIPDSGMASWKGADLLVQGVCL